MDLKREKAEKIVKVDKSRHSISKVVTSGRKMTTFDDPGHRRSSGCLLLGPVRQGHVLGALHLDQARGRAFEFEGPVALGIEPRRWRFRRADEVDLGRIKGIDQGDETLGFVPVVRTHLGDAVEDERVEALGDGQVVAGAERFVAEVVKGRILLINPC